MSAHPEVDFQLQDNWNNRQQQGTLQDRYENYLALTDEETPKTFEEWING